MGSRGKNSIGINLSAGQEQRSRHREWTRGYSGVGIGGANRESILTFLKSTLNKVFINAQLVYPSISWQDWTLDLLLYFLKVKVMSFSIHFKSESFLNLQMCISPKVSLQFTYDFPKHQKHILCSSLNSMTQVLRLLKTSERLKLHKGL